MTEVGRPARAADPLEKWRQLAFTCFLLTVLVPAAGWFLPISNGVFVALQLLMAVPFGVAVVVLVASWGRRRR